MLIVADDRRYDSYCDYRKVNRGEEEKEEEEEEEEEGTFSLPTSTLSKSIKI